MAVPGIWLIGFLHYSLLSDYPFGSFEMLTVPLPISSISLGLTGWRVLRVIHFFKKGTPVEGSVTALRLFGDRGRLEFSYKWRDGSFTSWMPIHKCKRVREGGTLHTVTVLLDAQRPGSAIVAEVFATHT